MTFRMQHSCRRVTRVQLPCSIRCRAVSAVSVVSAIWITVILHTQSICASPVPQHQGEPEINDTWKRCHGYNSTQCQYMLDLQQQLLDKISPSFASHIQNGSSDALPSPQTFSQDSAPETTPEEVIFHTVEQLEEMINGPQDNRRYKRKMDLFEAQSTQWELPIRIRFEENGHTEDDKARIREGIQHWQDETCIRFHEMDEYEDRTTPHILFTKYAACGSYIGFVNLIPQMLDLDARCLDLLGVIAHEIGHAIGFWHEHQRSDRDDYITVHENNARNVYTFYTEISRTGSTLNDIPYDHGSAMHYDADTLSLRGAPTIRTKNPLYQQTIGQRIKLSFMDIKLANLAYCADSCAAGELRERCERGGYQDPNRCDRCKCADGFQGHYCEQVADPVNARCGGEYNMYEGERLTLMSPGYDVMVNNIYNYHNYQHCSWLIKTDRRYRVRLEFQGSFGVYIRGGVCVHWVEVRYASDLSLTGPRMCGWDRPNHVFLSDNNEMLVLFRTDYQAAAWHRRGFSAEVSIVDATLRVVGPPDRQPDEGDQPRPSICTMPGEMDLAFLLDASASVGQNNWIASIDFVKAIVDRLDVSRTKHRIALIYFGSRARLGFLFDMYFNKDDLFDRLDELTWREESTDISGALRQMRREVFTEEYGSRDDVPHVAILLTNGEDNVNPHRVSRESQYAHDAGITVFTVPIGNHVDAQQISDITSDEDQDHRFTIYDYEELPTIVDDVVSGLCIATGQSVAAPRPTQPPPHDNEECGLTDLAFILDSSGSIGERNWPKVLNFAKDVAREVVRADTGSREGELNRVAVITYGNKATVHIELEEFERAGALSSPDAMLSAFDQIQYKDQWTNTSGGIYKAREEVFNPGYGGSGRSARKVAALLTDGQSNKDQDRTIPEAQQAREEGIQFIVIGVGGNIEISELLGIVGRGNEAQIHEVESFDALGAVVEDVYKQICQLPTHGSTGDRDTTTPTQPPPVNTGCRELDLAFGLDSSSSVGYNGWNHVLQFVESFVDGLTIGEYDNHVAVVSYGSEVALEIRFDDYFDDSSLIRAIRRMPYLQFGTNTPGALSEMRRRVFAERRGDRPNNSNILIMVMDGPADIDERQTRREARDLKEQGVEIYVIGVGSRVDHDEMNDIASNRLRDHILTVDDYQELQDTIDELYEKICTGDSSGVRHQSQSLLQESSVPIAAIEPVRSSSTDPAQEHTVWGEWTSCSRDCGGCGRRWRFRQCYDDRGALANCGSPQVEHCNDRVCEAHETCVYYRNNARYEESCSECCNTHYRVGDVCVVR